VHFLVNGALQLLRGEGGTLFGHRRKHAI
jgi:hypothetical protein